MNVEDILNWPIVSESQLGDINLGISLNEFENRLINYNDILERRIDGDYVFYIFFKSVTFCFSMITKKLGYIYLSNQFTGKYQNHIGLGSTLYDVNQLAHDKFNYDIEDEYYIEGHQGYIELNVTNYLDEEPSDDQLKSCVIENMSIQLNEQKWRGLSINDVKEPNS